MYCKNRLVIAAFSKVVFPNMIHKCGKEILVFIEPTYSAPNYFSTLLQFRPDLFIT